MDTIYGHYWISGNFFTFWEKTKISIFLHGNSKISTRASSISTKNSLFWLLNVFLIVLVDNLSKNKIFKISSENMRILKIFFFHRLSTKTIGNTLDSQKTQFLFKIELTRVKIFEIPCKKIKILFFSQKVKKLPEIQ